MNNNDSNQQRDGKNHPPMAELMLFRAIHEQNKANEARKKKEAEAKSGQKFIGHQEDERKLRKQQRRGHVTPIGDIRQFNIHEGLTEGSKVIQTTVYCDSNRTVYQDSDVDRTRPFYISTFHNEYDAEMIRQNPYPTGTIINIYNQHDITFQMGRRYVITMETEEDFCARVELLRKLRAMQQQMEQSEKRQFGHGDGDNNGSTQQQQQPGE